jgi:DNA-binding NtrC family response regulator
LVDDDSDIVNLFKEILESYDYVVNGFTNPLEALQHYITNCNQYGMVISDIRMPEMTGFDLLKEIKKIDVTISYFLMSAYDTVDFAELADIKIDGFIQKPIQIKKLLSIIEKNFNENYDTISSCYN